MGGGRNEAQQAADENENFTINIKSSDGKVFQIKRDEADFSGLLEKEIAANKDKVKKGQPIPVDIKSDILEVVLKCIKKNRDGTFTFNSGNINANNFVDVLNAFAYFMNDKVNGLARQDKVKGFTGKLKKDSMNVLTNFNLAEFKKNKFFDKETTDQLSKKFEVLLAL